MVLQVRPTLTVDNTLLCDVHGGMAVYVLVLAAAFTLDGLSRYYQGMAMFILADKDSCFNLSATSSARPTQDKNVRPHCKAVWLIVDNPSYE